MTPAERQENLNNISPDDLAKIQSVSEKSIKIEVEDLIEAEFALRFGWGAYTDYQNELVSAEQMGKLLVSARKLDSLAQYRAAQAAFIGSGSAQSTKPSQTFAALTNPIRKDSEVDA